MYSDKVLEHFKNPRNVGEMENASGVGEVGNAKCGDIMKLFIKVDDDGIITDAKFQTFGCASAIASSSISTEMIIGKHIEEAKKLSNKAIAEALDGLPKHKLHCSVLAADALSIALDDYHGVKRPDEDEVICKCMGVSRAEIEEAIAHGSFKYEAIKEQTTAMTGACQAERCKGPIDEILNKYNDGSGDHDHGMEDEFDEDEEEY